MELLKKKVTNFRLCLKRGGGSGHGPPVSEPLFRNFKLILNPIFGIPISQLSFYNLIWKLKCLFLKLVKIPKPNYDT